MVVNHPLASKERESKESTLGSVFQSVSQTDTPWQLCETLGGEAPRAFPEDNGRPAERVKSLHLLWSTPSLGTSGHPASTLSERPGKHLVTFGRVGCHVITDAQSQWDWCHSPVGVCPGQLFLHRKGAFLKSHGPWEARTTLSLAWQ